MSQIAKHCVPLTIGGCAFKIDRFVRYICNIPFGPDLIYGKASDLVIDHTNYLLTECRELKSFMVEFF
jgi:hypothetical protein